MDKKFMNVIFALVGILVFFALVIFVLGKDMPPTSYGVDLAAANTLMNRSTVGCAGVWSDRFP